MAVLGKFRVTLLAVMASCASAGVLKVGGHIQDDYKNTFQKWVDWADTNTATLTYTVTTSFTTYDSATMAAAVTKMTTKTDASYVDVLVCPYTSGAVKACVDAVAVAYTGPVLIFGGASDSIFTENCARLTNKNCFGFLTPASKYTESGLVALDGKMSATAQVAIISNANSFSKSVAAGTNATITANSGLSLQSSTEISVQKADLTPADVILIAAAMAKKPDIVVITGHNLDVEPAVIQIGKNSHAPQAIIAVNGLTALANYKTDDKYANCVMMPTQWDSSTTTKDTVVGWTSADFNLAMGGSATEWKATYQQASAASMGVALANALAKDADVEKLVATLQGLDVDSFYGKLKFDSKGAIEKPMYTEQKQGNANQIVAPTGTMSFPLLSGSCWGSFAVRVGGPIQEDYKKGFELWVDWANKQGKSKIVSSLVPFDSTTMAAGVAKMTTQGDPAYVDALVCPYASGNVKACVDAVNKDYAGPVLNFGGASDSIFTTNCAALPKKNCFGFLTVASKYTQTGLVALDGKISANATVALITNANTFSLSVATGTNATIQAAAGLELQSFTKISVQKTELAAADVTAIADAMAQKPDIVVITGHNKDVEPAVIQIGKNAHTPQAILAVNGLTNLEHYKTDDKYANCVMMPTQWDSSTSTKDPVVGWTSADFITAMGGAATYQQAAATSMGIALSNALGQDATAANLVATLKGLDVDSFYGKLKWDDKGRMQKPMYTQQKQGSDMKVVAPTGTMSFPLSGTSCWGGTTEENKTAGTAQVSSAVHSNMAVSFVISAIGVLWLR